MTETKTYLSFEMHGEVFAVDVDNVLNILEMIHITHVPNSRDYMRGVINLRGTVLPVVDLRVKFGLPVKENTRDTSIIVLNITRNDEEVTVGALVDAVREVLEIKPKEIIPNPAIGTRYKSEIISGMISSGEHFTMLLDIDKVFANHETVSAPSSNELAETEA